MGDCAQCGESDVLTRNCNHCDKTVCTEHILPESHDCPAVEHFGDGTKQFQSDLDARQDEDAGTNETNTYRCEDCGDAYDYYADARHCCQPSPDPVENPRTYGGSGRDSENADFPSSPNVNPDGTATDSEIEELREKYATEDSSNYPRLRWFKRWVVPYLIVGGVLAVLQFGFGIDVVLILTDVTS